METHQPDSTSDQDPWDTLTSELSHLRDRLKDVFASSRSDAGPTDEEIKDAVRTLTAAWDRLSASLSTAIEDPRTRAHLKNAASSLAAAFRAGISDLDDLELVDGGGDRAHRDPGP